MAWIYLLRQQRFSEGTIFRKFAVYKNHLETAAVQEKKLIPHAFKCGCVFDTKKSENN